MAEENKTQEKKEEKKTEIKEIPKKRIIVFGKDSPISLKHSRAVCRMINGKGILEAMKMMEEVALLKRAVPMRGELPHRKGKRMCSGRYPVNAARVFIKLLKSLNANASNLGQDASQLIIHAKTNTPSRRRFSRRAKFFKRSDVIIELKRK